jgi:hypothetical protein
MEVVRRYSAAYPLVLFGVVHGSGSLRIHAATAWYVAALGGLECAGPLRWITCYHVLCFGEVVNR